MGRFGYIRAPEQRAIIEDFAGAPWLDEGLTTRPLPPIDDSLRRLEIPVLIMNGENDLPDFVHVADEIEALLPEARRTYLAVFDPHDADDQYRMQADAITNELGCQDRAFDHLRDRKRGKNADELPQRFRLQ